MSIGFALPSGSWVVAVGEASAAVLPYCPTTRIDRPSFVVTAPIVSLLAAAPGVTNVFTCTGRSGWAGGTYTTATPPPAGGSGEGASGATALGLDGPAT